MTNDPEAQASWRRSWPERTVTVLAAAAVAASLLVGCSTEQEEPDRLKPNVPTEQESDDPAEESAVFAPYVDTSLTPAFDLVESARADRGEGVQPRLHHLRTAAARPSGAAAGPARQPGGAADRRAARPGRRRADLLRRASGTELARPAARPTNWRPPTARSSTRYELTKADFDIEGAALPDTAANDPPRPGDRQLQQQRTGTGRLLHAARDARGAHPGRRGAAGERAEDGVKVSAVNIMAMDYGTVYDGDMGEYAIEAATATQQAAEVGAGHRRRRRGVEDRRGHADDRRQRRQGRDLQARRRDPAAEVRRGEGASPGSRCGPPRATSRAPEGRTPRRRRRVRAWRRRRTSSRRRSRTERRGADEAKPRGRDGRSRPRGRRASAARRLGPGALHLVRGLGRTRRRHRSAAVVTGLGAVLTVVGGGEGHHDLVLDVLHRVGEVVVEDDAEDQLTARRRP